MRVIFEEAAANAERRCTRSGRGLAWVLVPGRLRVRNDGAGTATVEVIDDFTNVTVASISATASPFGEQSGQFDIPYSYTVKISSVASTPSLFVGIDGDAGDSGDSV